MQGFNYFVEFELLSLLEWLNLYSVYLDNNLYMTEV